jgi:hypothetical protein
MMLGFSHLVLRARLEMADHDAKVSVSQRSFDRSWPSSKSTNSPGQTSAVPPVVVLTESLSR